MGKAVQEVNLTLSQTADELELYNSVDFQILPDDWDWRFHQQEPSQSMIQPMTPKTEPNDTSYDVWPVITAGNVTPGLALSVSSHVVGPESTSGRSRSVPPVSSEDIKHLVENHEDGNTKKNTGWPEGVFFAWRQSRHTSGSEFVQDNQSMTVGQMNYYLSRFVIEAPKKDDEPYPPKTPYLICAGLLGFLRNNGVYDKNFLDTNPYSAKKKM